MAEKGAQAALGVQGDREHKESQGEAGVPAGGGGGGQQFRSMPTGKHMVCIREVCLGFGL